MRLPQRMSSDKHWLPASCDLGGRPITGIPVDTMCSVSAAAPLVELLDFPRESSSATAESGMRSTNRGRPSTHSETSIQP